MIAYDIATLADVAYSVPDNIKVSYSPPSPCKFESNINPAYVEMTGQDRLICFDGFMNITDFQLRADVRETEYPVIKGHSVEAGTRSIPSSLDSMIDVFFPLEVLDEEELSRPTIASFGAFTNLRDYGAINKDIIELDVLNGINIEKNRKIIFN